jgi:hypothetical protein
VYVEGNLLTEFTPSTHSSSTFEISVNFPQGFSVLCCRAGVLVTGGDGQGNKAWVWQNGELKPLPDMANSHEYHCSIIYDDKALVVGGPSPYSDLLCLEQ